MNGDRSNKPSTRLRGDLRACAGQGKGKQEDNRAAKGGKNTTNMARTRKQKRDASKRYQELNREVKRRCRRDRMVYVELEAKRAEEAGKRGNARTLYAITRKLSGRFQNTCKPVRNEAGVLLRSAKVEGALSNSA